jgi:mRNA-decapping enzyme 1B
MSHPAAHTLEHIEKQQRSITPQPSTHQSQSVTISSTNRSKRRNKATPQQESVMSTSTSISQDLPLPVTQSATDSNGPTGFLRIQSPTNTSSLKNHQSMNVANTNNANPLASLFAHASGSTVRK